MSHLGTVIAERSLGAVAPERIGNHDVNFGLHGVGQTRDGADVAISCLPDQLHHLLQRIGVNAEQQVWGCIKQYVLAELTQLLSGSGIAWAKVQDMSDVVRDERRWQRGCFTTCSDQLLFAPVWGGGVRGVWAPSAVGADNEAVFRDIVGLNPSRIQELIDMGTLGQQPIDFSLAPSATVTADIQRGLTARMEPPPELHLRAALGPRVPISTVHGSITSPLRKRVVEFPTSVGAAYIGKLLVDMGWDVIRVERPSVGGKTPALPIPYHWGPGQGGAEFFLN